MVPFGLTNAPTTSFTLVSKVFHPYLDQFMVVYLEDIVFYKKGLEENIEHLKKGFSGFVRE